MHQEISISSHRVCFFLNKSLFIVIADDFEKSKTGVYLAVICLRVFLRGMNKEVKLLLLTPVKQD